MRRALNWFVVLLSVIVMFVGLSLHSSRARFDGDRVFAFTLQRIDPLYLADLYQPGDPLIARRLLLPGSAGFLHPVSEHRSFVHVAGETTERFAEPATIILGQPDLDFSLLPTPQLDQTNLSFHRAFIDDSAPHDARD